MRQPSLRGGARNRKVVMPLPRGICSIRDTASVRRPPASVTFGEFTNLFTMLRLPTRETRPPLRTVITLALRKIAPAEPVPGGGRVLGPNPPIPVPLRRD